MTSALARQFALDVAPYVSGTLPTSGSIAWTRFKGVTDFDPNVNPTMQDVSDYDSNGWSNTEKTMQAAVWSVKARRPFDAGIYDPGQEIVRATQLAFADATRVFGRYYDRNGGSSAEARVGVFVPTWDQDKTGVADIAAVAVKLTSDGQVFPIANPYSASVVPTISNVTPAGKGTGQAVTILGSNFSGTVPTTGVKFGGTNATDFTVLSDGSIVAVLPTGGAGTTAVLVTNATGPSNSFNYTRAA